MQRVLEEDVRTSLGAPIGPAAPLPDPLGKLAGGLEIRQVDVETSTMKCEKAAAHQTNRNTCTSPNPYPTNIRAASSQLHPPRASSFRPPLRPLPRLFEIYSLKQPSAALLPFASLLSSSSPPASSLLVSACPALPRPNPRGLAALYLYPPRTHVQKKPCMRISMPHA
ncbi:hypothetical protein IE81DRAFT_101117 [Ceraceosorus guamensis]|uniref:Uncharacterized protein n=1 Tax=Ceraceosorus guamensis TaxID=1522189 RepID=A0A316VM08_9BASI|nr:hypothetical protein IE81DRAFT_101117 [Ceraceosorus guamensis]PWN38659.1 hypothetical protein IE81DRAFT_101117 [Ceraceosorus guamensis]